MDTNKYDLGYRPVTYFDTFDSVVATISNIKGEQRKQLARKLLEAGRWDDLNELLTKEKLSDEERSALGRVHPVLMGGEYLPDYETGQVEIARVALESTTADVISVRARRKPGGKISYSIVDEYETEFEFEPQESDRPLTLSELIALIDGSKPVGEDEMWRGRTNSYRNIHLEGGTAPEELLTFAAVSSDFYPELQAYYREEAERWLESVR